MSLEGWICQIWLQKKKKQLHAVYEKPILNMSMDQKIQYYSILSKLIYNPGDPNQNTTSLSYRHWQTDSTSIWEIQTFF